MTSYLHLNNNNKLTAINAELLHSYGFHKIDKQVARHNNCYGIKGRPKQKSNV